MGRETAAEVAGLTCSDGRTKQLGTVEWNGVEWSKFSMERLLEEEGKTARKNFLVVRLL